MIEITFGKEDRVSFQWQPYDTPIARRWMATLQKAIPHGIYEADRFYNWPLSSWSRSTIVEAITDNLWLIEEYQPGTIEVWPTLEMTSAMTNELHVHFEKLRGDFDHPPEFFRTAPTVIRKAVESLNLLIHRWESMIRSEQAANPTLRVCCTFKRNLRHLLHDEDYSHFTLTRTFGVLYINYCETGKPLYDVFKDNDVAVGDDNIKPLKYYSADFSLCFHDNVPQAVADQAMINFNAWFTRHRAYLTSLGFQQGDPKLAIGLIPVATLASDWSRQDIIDAIAQRQHVHAVRWVPSR